jgi:hypothetical protein
MDLYTEVPRLRKEGQKPSQIAESIGVSIGKVLNILSYLARTQKGIKPVTIKKSIQIAGLMKKEDFVKPYDIAQQLRETIGAFGGGVIEDESLRRHLKVSESKWKILRNMEEFRDFQLMVCNRRIWGQEITLDEVRRKIDLTESI